MSSVRSPDANTSQPSLKRGREQQKPSKSRSSNHEASTAQTVINQHIYGGQGGTGGQGGLHGGGGGSGKGPTLHYEAEYLTINVVHSPNVVEGPRVMNHCPPASRIFHGRRTILDVMHQFFAQDTQKQKIYVLHGLGGAGKTQIALKFIEESTCFTDQVLLDASTTETIQKGLRNLSVTKKAGTTSQDALTWLTGKEEHWLLFFDNADDPEINLNHFLPRCNHGNIIITSRNPSLRMYGAHSQVSDMEESDAVALLLKSSQQDVSESNQLLAQDIVKQTLRRFSTFLTLPIVVGGGHTDLSTQTRLQLLQGELWDHGAGTEVQHTLGIEATDEALCVPSVRVPSPYDAILIILRSYKDNAPSTTPFLTRPSLVTALTHRELCIRHRLAHGHLPRRCTSLAFRAWEAAPSRLTTLSDLLR
ncbi:FabD lysophospholipase-like protein [Mycena sanguinolenta]|uniref:FabD lysophospholipase-like protein n=1 Tax=Mycena sanguinolenta TaxID=230812 RepID=A0A8H7DFP6_9AGAR|nr:FabD lysophospholipase-like protein [Mycena sanguinolenta]